MRLSASLASKVASLRAGNAPEREREQKEETGSKKKKERSPQCVD